MATYCIGLYMDREAFEQKCRKRKNVLITGLVLLVSELFVFKYWDFTAGQLNSLLNLSGIAFQIPLIKTNSLIVPLGISFFIFQSIGYLIDVCRRNIRS